MAVDQSIQRRQSQLTRGKLPSYAVWVVLAAAVILGAALSSLIGFSVAGWAVISAIVFVIGATLVTAVAEGGRKATDRLVTYLVYGAFILALIPLISVLWTVLERGLPGLSYNFFFTSMNGITGAIDNQTVEDGTPVLGGAYHAIIGTLQITFWATLISVPIGLLTAVYLVEYGQGKSLTRAITFFVDVMTGIPSIVAGLFAAALFALLFGPGTRMGFVASVALSVLMIPVVVRATEEMLKIVPNELREASYALGVRKWRTITRVVIPTAISGIASGVTLSIARVIGETAPILVTAGFATSINWSAFSGWMSSLPTYIYYQILTPTSPTSPDPSTQRAWAAALLLIVMVMILNLAARFIAGLFAPKTSR
ncbi:phosphate ABC transporter permease PstA [Arthrobacter agilis]|uniref:phosphate ABC transporter permease PstA n=1 Tax=Arthrobacter agilis TaxID=37921 RepID=UPI000B35B616|nr:phosphate ABC transporter permease PstA [Arthrobacter agilis]OUM42404.1 phosphate ABC transporter, permease protein PstA [Arthrobacter agilis]PPB45745.1 phosphate ABC transporter permease PtsA [Arthrobacter agilis]TPV26273.1 phosphate ABC transporter permease PstA [Arthrobacter agilis]VDR30876.1 Phosphate transport system permease protein pstA [Arthrobacter agilis]